MLKKLVVTTFLLGILFAAKPVSSVTLDFEDIPDLTSVNDFYSSYGISFQNAISLTAGFSLNEFDFPPSSGLVAIGDDYGPIVMTFVGPVQNIFANFTYAAQLTFSSFDSSGALLGTFVNPASANLGNTELISLNFSGVSSLVIAGSEANSFIMDDLNYTPSAVPEPSTIALLGLGIIPLLWSRRRRSEKRGS